MKIRKHLCFYLSLALCITMIIPCMASEKQDLSSLRSSQVQASFKDQLIAENIIINDSSVFSTKSLYNENGTENGSALLITSICEDGNVEQTMVTFYDSSNNILPVELESIARSVSPGYNLTNGWVNNAAFSITTTVSYYIYSSSSTLYIRPYSAAFSYYYNSGYSGTLSATFRYYTSGEKCTYPGFSVINSNYTHVITVSKTNAAQRTNYQTINDLGYGYCISQPENGTWGVITVTRNGASYDYYVNVLG